MLVGLDVGATRATAVAIDETGAVQAYAVQYLKPEWKVLDPGMPPLAQVSEGNGE